MPTRLANPRTAPVRTVSRDQAATIGTRTRRWPNRSPAHPLGISKMPYASAKELKTYPIWMLVSARSSLMNGAATEMQTRSR